MNAAQFKDSGHAWIGDIPRHWAVRRLVCVAKLESGHTPDRSNPAYWLDSNDVPWVSLADTKTLAASDYIHDTALHVNAAGLANSSAHVLPARAVVFTRDATIGKAAITTREMAVSQHIIAWICGSELHPEYLLNVFYAMTSELDRLTSGATLRTIGMPDVRTLVTPLPPVPEQLSIATFVGRKTAAIDALIAKKQRLIELLQEKQQALITQAVTKGLDPNVPMKDSGVEWIGRIPEGWSTSRVRYIARVVSKGTTPSTVGRDMVERGIRFIKAENITAGGVSEEPQYFVDEETDRILTRSRLRAHDVLVVIAGATMGKAAVIGPGQLPANTNQAVCFIRLSNPDLAWWLLTWLQAAPVQRQLWLSAVQSAQPNLSMSDIRALPVPIPNAADMERVLSKLRRMTEPLVATVQRVTVQIEALQEYRQALITAAVTGKLDIPAAPEGDVDGQAQRMGV